MTESGVPAPSEAEAAPDAADAPAAVAPTVDAPTVDGRGGPGRPGGGRVAGLMAAVVLVIVTLDQITKTWALRALDDGESVRVVGSLLRFTLTYNKGMAFSRGSGLGPIIGVVAMVVIVLLLVTLRRESSPLARVALSAVIGGAIGNIIDRIFRAGDGGFMGGAVVDFIQLPRWPVFNIADMAVTLGGLTLVIGAWRSGRAASAASSAPAP